MDNNERQCFDGKLREIYTFYHGKKVDLAAGIYISEGVGVPSMACLYQV